MVKTRRSSKTACALTLFAIFHIACVHGETVGRWSFDGTVGATVSIGTRFLNKMNSSKFPADVVNRYNSSASTGHLSSISTFDAEPFDACRESKFGVDMRVDKSLHFDGNPGNSQGCPLYIDDSDGELELQSFTFEFFVRRPKPASGVKNQHQVFISKMYHYFGQGQGTYYNGLYRNGNQNNANSVWRYHWCCVTNAAGDVGFGDIDLGSSGIEDGQWHHIALTVDGESHKVGFFIDHHEIKTADLPGQLAYGYSGGGTVERHPWVVGNHEQYGGYSWNGDIAEVRISDVPLQTKDMLWQGSSVQDGGTVMWLPLDDDFTALDWSRLQTTNGTFETAVTNAIEKGTAAFSEDVLNLRIVDGSKTTLRKHNNGCLALNGGYVDLAITPFKPEIYDAMTVEFFFKASFASGRWLSLAACRQDTVTTGNNYPNRLPFLFQENGSHGLNCRTDTPESKDQYVLIPSASSPFDGKWHHAALIISHGAEHTNQTITVYFDHSEVGSKSIKGVFTTLDYHFLRFGHNDQQSVMMLDEFRISRGALPVSSFMRQTGPAGMAIILR